MNSHRYLYYQIPISNSPPIIYRQRVGIITPHVYFWSDGEWKVSAWSPTTLAANRLFLPITAREAYYAVRKQSPKQISNFYDNYVKPTI